MRPSTYWAPILEEMRRTGEDIESFRQQKIYAHIDNSNAHHGRHLPSMQRRCDEAWELLKDEIGDLRCLVEDSERGSPVRFPIPGTPYTGTLASIEYAWMCSRLRPAWPFRRVVEIGGGYGGLAYAVLRAFPETRYTIVDFPELVRVQSYFLEDYLDQVTFLRPGEDVLGAVDLFINTRSMMEMDLDQVRWYLGMIRNRIAEEGHFYCLNRVAKVTRLSDYPFDPRWQKLSDRTFPLQESIRELMFRNPEVTRDP